jgi:hypothetical protein
MSTLANMVELLLRAPKALRQNESISLPFVAYQGMLMFSTLIRCVCVCVCVCVCACVCM